MYFLTGASLKAQPLRWESDWGVDNYWTPCLGNVTIAVHQTTLMYPKEMGYFWRETFTATMTDEAGNIYFGDQVLNEAGHWDLNYNGHLLVHFMIRDINGKLVGMTRYRGHVTVNAQGELTAYKDSFEFICF